MLPMLRLFPVLAPDGSERGGSGTLVPAPIPGSLAAKCRLPEGEFQR
jgi:hypothetical protein